VLDATSCAPALAVCAVFLQVATATVNLPGELLGLNPVSSAIRGQQGPPRSITLFHRHMPAYCSDTCKTELLISRSRHVLPWNVWQHRCSTVT